MTSRIRRQDLQAKLDTGTPPVLVEALGSGYWADAHLPGALNIPADQVDRLAPRLLPDRDAEIIIYSSASSTNADTAARRLVDLGYQHVLVYTGGKEDWIEHGLPVERAEPAESPYRRVGRHAVPSPPPAPTRDGADSASSLADIVCETAAGQLLPNVHRCLVRIENARWPDGWTKTATTHPDDDGRLDANAAFRIASITKLVTATALMALVDQRRCDLDEPTSRHLPSAILDRFHDSRGRPYAADLTLRQLLDHTSGLPNYFYEPPILDAVRHGDGRRHFTPLDLIDLAAAAPPPTTPPGTPRIYTDTGFLLAGLIVESITRLPLHQAYRDLVLDPAGMTDTWLESSNEPPRRSEITRHELDGHDITNMDPTVDWAGGGLVSTAADLAALLRALTRGDVLSTAAWQQMTRWEPGPEGYYDNYGIGLGQYQFPTAQLIGHHGAWGAFAFWSPELDAIITGTVSTAKVNRRPLLAAIVEALTN